MKSMIIGTILLSVSLFLNSCKKDTDEMVVVLAAGQTREYFIAADEVEWNYSPSSTNLFTGMPYTNMELVYLVNDTNRIGRKNIKAIYRLYTDASFSTLTTTADDAEKGILGPVIRAEVGDKIKVTFNNRTKFSMSMHPHGVQYDSDNEGVNAVEPGTIFIYNWGVPESAGPASGDVSSVCWMYHSHVMTNMMQDINAGLVGPLIVYKKGFLTDNKAKDMDVEKFSFFSVIDENLSLYLDSNIIHYTDGTVDKNDPGFKESNMKHSINGLMFGNQHYYVKLGQNVRWYLIALGNEVDWHTAHWHGNTVVFKDNRTDVVALGPANMLVADMKASNAGTWQYHCHVDSHMTAGMDAIYTVQ